MLPSSDDDSLLMLSWGKVDQTRQLSNSCPVCVPLYTHSMTMRPAFKGPQDGRDPENLQAHSLQVETEMHWATAGDPQRDSSQSEWGDSSCWMWSHVGRWWWYSQESTEWKHVPPDDMDHCTMAVAALLLNTSWQRPGAVVNWTMGEYRSARLLLREGGNGADVFVKSVKEH